MTAPATGVRGQLGYAAESTYGTAVTVTRFQEFVSESFTQEIARLEAKGVRQDALVLPSARWAAGSEDVKGSLTQEIHNKSFGLMFKHMLGGSSVAQPDSGSNPTVYENTLTPARLDGLSLTMEVGWKDTGGNGFKKTIEGAQCVGWEISSKVGEFAMLKTDWIAEHLADTTSVTAVSYPSSTSPFTFTQGALTIGGSAVPVEEVTLTGKNALDGERRFLGTTVRAQAPDMDYREYAGSCVAEFASWTAYDRFVNGTEAALTVFFTGATISGSYKYALEITANVRFDGDTPTVDGRGRIKQPLKFKCVASTIDTASTALSMVYRTTDSSA